MAKDRNKIENDLILRANCQFMTSLRRNAKTPVQRNRKENRAEKWLINLNKILFGAGCRHRNGTKLYAFHRFRQRWRRQKNKLTNSQFMRFVQTSTRLMREKIAWPRKWTELFFLFRDLFFPIFAFLRSSGGKQKWWRQTGSRQMKSHDCIFFSVARLSFFCVAINSANFTQNMIKYLGWNWAESNNCKCNKNNKRKLCFTAPNDCRRYAHQHIEWEGFFLSWGSGY